jgi:hypothetical protein
MALLEDLEELLPATEFRDWDETASYWVQENTVYFRHQPVRGAHAASFRFYRNCFAKDHKHCYCVGRRLVGANPGTLRPLSFTYVTDGSTVWALGGRIKDADATSFVACDDGVNLLSGGVRVPYGFGKDHRRVFYYDFNGTPSWVRKASPDSFISLNDGIFGKDASFVFCGAAVLPKAKVASWEKLGGYYSRDSTQIFYFNRPLPDADYDSFEVVLTDRSYIQLAKDKNHFYNNDLTIPANSFAEKLAKYT